MLMSWPWNNGAHQRSPYDPGIQKWWPLFLSHDDSISENALVHQCRCILISVLAYFEICYFCHRISVCKIVSFLVTGSNLDSDIDQAEYSFQSCKFHVSLDSFTLTESVMLVKSWYLTSLRIPLDMCVQKEAEYLCYLARTTYRMSF